MNTRFNRFVKNIAFSVFSKLIIFILGIIIPRLIILSYGSEANGLLSSSANIFSYIALIQAGVGTVAIQALYKPIAENNRNRISEIVVTTQNYFRKLIKWYFLGVLIFAIVYPLVVKTTLSFWTIFGVIFIQGISNILTYGFASTVCQLLSADGKEYVSQIVQLAVFIINSVVKISLVLLGTNIVVLQCAYLIVNIGQIIIYRIYVKKNYPWLNWNAQPDNDALKNRKRYMINGISWTVFNSTDTMLISIICGFAYASIYAMYNLVYANLNTMVAMIYGSSYFILGQTFHKNKQKYLELHDGFEAMVSSISFSVTTITYILILPFIEYYTRGIKDIVYVDQYLPLLFCMVHILSNCRLISGNLINICNRPDLTNKASIIETIMNLTLSITFALLWGLHGVLIATIIALAYKTNFIIIISNRKLLNRSPLKTYLTLGINVFIFLIFVFMRSFWNIKVYSFAEFIFYAIPVSIIVFIVFFIVNILINREFKVLFKDFIIRIKRN